MTAYPIIPITHSIVAAQAIEGEVARRWGLAGTVYCELMSRGVNDYYMVRHGSALYAARLMRHKLRPRPRAEYEALIARFYFDRGFAVTAPIAASDGKFVHEVLAPEGVRYLSLFTWAEGKMMSRDGRPAVAERLGATVARMHLAAPEFRPPHPFVVDVPSYLRERVSALIRMVEDHPEDRTYYPPLIERVAIALAAIDRQRIPNGATHNDIHVDNVLVAEDGTPTIIDWDNCGEDFFARDLTHFLWRNIYSGQGADISTAFMRGYEAVRPLTTAERDLMPLLLLGRHLGILVGIAGQVNVVGHTAVGYAHSLPRFRTLVRDAARAAGLS